MYVTAIWYILGSFGKLVVIWYIFPHFGILYQEKSGNPALKQCDQKCFGQATQMFQSRPKMDPSLENIFV
jgi:hypothetical protein